MADPDLSDPGQGGEPGQDIEPGQGGPFGIDFQDPAVQAAMEQCQELVPNFAGGQGGGPGFNDGVRRSVVPDGTDDRTMNSTTTKGEDKPYIARYPKPRSWRGRQGPDEIEPDPQIEMAADPRSDPDVILVGVALWYVRTTQTGAHDAKRRLRGADFAEVVVTDLVETSEYEGTWVVSDGDPINVRLEGTVTALPEEGTTLEQGDVIAWVDNQPAVLLYGDLPVGGR